MSNTTDQFKTLGLSPPLLQALEDVGYETPSPIQAECIPLLLAGRDVIGQAQTGTGKTAAFALPMLSRLNLAQRVPQILVLTPTRELAIQVAEAFQTYAKHLPGFHVLPVYGGQGMGQQLKQLARGVHAIVGTPGRIMDHLERKTLHLDNITSLTLDEADEMLRMGFIDAVESILQRTPPERQTALFSATMPAPIRRVAARYLNDPVEVKIRSKSSSGINIRQRYWQVRGTDKLEALTRILEVEVELDAAIIFVRTKTETVVLAEKLEARGYEAAALNGDLTQPLRERTIEQLKNGQIDIIVATDVAARGLDVARISHVINYDIPQDSEAYVHRIGRTGRAGRPGDAILFVSSRELHMLRTIERDIKQTIEPMNLPTREDVLSQRVRQFKDEVVASIANENLSFCESIVSQLISEQNLSPKHLAAALMFMAQRDRPLQATPATETAEAMGKEKSPGKLPKTNRGAGTETEKHTTGEGGRYRIDAGKSQGISAGDIVGALANEGTIAIERIGAIRLFDTYSTVEISGAMSNAQMLKLAALRVRRNVLGLRPDTDNQRPDNRPHKLRAATYSTARSAARTTAEPATKPRANDDRPRVASPYAEKPVSAAKPKKEHRKGQRRG